MQSLDELDFEKLMRGLKPFVAAAGKVFA